MLYGLNWAKGEIVAQGEVVICEGYTDVMAFALAGVPNAVATCGTALADEHFLTLKNLARKVTLAYDADAAGQAAAERCYQWEQRSRCSSRSPISPPVAIPADVWQDDPRQRRSSAVKGATPFLEFRIERLLARGRPVDARRSRARAAKRAAAMIVEHPERSRARPVRDEARGSARHRARSRARRRSATCAQPSARASRRRAGPRRRSRQSVDRRELDALRWAVQAPGVDERASRRRPCSSIRSRVNAFDGAHRSWPWHECLEQASPEVAALLQRLAVEEPDDRGADRGAGVRM